MELAHTLLTGPLGGLDGSDLRRLGRALREEERAAVLAAAEEEEAGQGGPAAMVRPSDELVREALAHPEQLVTLDLPPARRARELGMLLRKVRDLLVGGGTAEEALWELWDGSPAGASGWSGPRCAVAPSAATPTATWTRSARSSRPLPGPRTRSPGTAAPSTCSPRSRPRTSPPTP